MGFAAASRAWHTDSALVTATSPFVKDRGHPVHSASDALALPHPMAPVLFLKRALSPSGRGDGNKDTCRDFVKNKSKRRENKGFRELLRKTLRKICRAAFAVLVSRATARGKGLFRRAAGAAKGPVT